MTKFSFADILAIFIFGIPVAIAIAYEIGCRIRRGKVVE